MAFLFSSLNEKNEVLQQSFEPNLRTPSDELIYSSQSFIFPKIGQTSNGTSSGNIGGRDLKPLSLDSS